MKKQRISCGMRCFCVHSINGQILKTAQKGDVGLPTRETPIETQAFLVISDFHRAESRTAGARFQSQTRLREDFHHAESHTVGAW